MPLVMSAATCDLPVGRFTWLNHALASRAFWIPPAVTNNHQACNRDVLKRRRRTVFQEEDAAAESCSTRRGAAERPGTLDRMKETQSAMAVPGRDGAIYAAAMDCPGKAVRNPRGGFNRFFAIRSSRGPSRRETYLLSLCPPGFFRTGNTGPEKHPPPARGIKYPERDKTPDFLRPEADAESYGGDL
jgi:hypothetical protein